MREKLTRQVLFWGILCTPILLSANVKNIDNSISFETFGKLLKEVQLIRLENPDSAIHLCQLSYEYFLEKKDTFSAVNSLTTMAIIYGHKAQYQSVYDNLWKALLLADQAKDDEAKILVYINLGRYYSFYKRKEKAIEYFQMALHLKKNLVEIGLAKKAALVPCYYAICSTYRELGDTLNARIYLDSAYLHLSPSGRDTSYYIKVESTFLNNRAGKHQEALDSLFAIQPWFEQNSPGFQVLLFTYCGDFYLSMGDELNGEKYYKKALAVAKTYNSHLDFVPTIYERLAKLYLDKKDYQNAYASLQQEKELNLQFFDSRSTNNKSLLEIKDNFQEEKEKQKQLVQEQRLAKFEHEERVAFLKNILLMVTLIFLVFAGTIYFYYVRNKHRAEKQLIRKKQELEVRQANELLELKNKELATSTLKLIEKDEILATLKGKLSQGNGDIKATELKKIVRTISHSNTQNWEEFEARFISVNKDFYQKLNSGYPKLSRGDQKLCALVKLNLSSKEMAKLLGISIESVHTNRYRLRKKLKLSREVSLTEFVATL